MNNLGGLKSKEIIMMHGSKFIITGAAGLVGQNLIIEFKNKNYNNIVALDKHHENIKVLRELYPEIEIIETDLTEKDEWESVFVCALVKLKRPLIENFWLKTNDPDMDIPDIIESGNLNPGDENTYGEKMLNIFTKINSNISASDLIDFKIHKYHFAQPICDPNFLSTLPLCDLPINGLREDNSSLAPLL